MTDPATAEHTITQLLHELDRRRKTRFRLNATRPINRLPVELLAFIFSQVQNCEPWSLFPPATMEEMKGFHSWLKLTRVCIHWRRTAISEPSLWARVYLPSDMKNQKGFLEMLLERARSFPLNLHRLLRSDDFAFWTLDKTLEEYQAFATRYSTQLRSLRLTSAGVSSTSSQLWKIFDYTFPQIQEIHLDIRSDDYDPVSNSLHRILSNEGNSIRRLSLTYVPWPAGASHLPHLTHLALRWQQPESCASYSTFLDTLQGCPRLQFLALHDAGPLATNADAVAGRVVRLPCLRRIEISWANTPAIWSPRVLLGHLDFAEDAEILLYAQYMFHNDYLAEVLSHLPPKRYLDRVSKLQLRKSGDTAILFRGESMCIDSTVRHDVYIRGFVPYLANVSTLIFDQAITVDQTNISMLLSPSHFSTIRFLHPTNFIPLVQALTDPNGYIAQSPPTEIYLPATSVEEMSKRYPLYRSKLQRYRDKDVSIVNREHLKQPALKLIFHQAEAALKPPFEGPLRRIVRGK
ncbi:hypothetical protein CVT26_011266 [Gymnopilus dilepis]|uniref:F-box domain-containing protein n=1 Tax=Gymnopilus dilepis TaxID=231916 RepID=A0A409VJJ7_9AGAR|nr:hypothetical protein CVT26_011266 [Gymnopilus dilepis]